MTVLGAAPRWSSARTLAEARSLQHRVASLVREVPLAVTVRLVAGVDGAYATERATSFAVVAVCDAESLGLVELVSAECANDVPYRPSYLAWRELPAVLAAWSKLSRIPDLVLCDAHGRAHPRRCGLACSLGVLLGVAAVGCAKSLLVGTHRDLAAARGAVAPLVDRGEVIGAAVRTRHDVRPVYASVGHLITLDEACAWVVRTSRTRIPEPLRAAHRAVSRLCREGGPARA